MGMTMAEKALSRASDRPEVKPGDYVTASIDILTGNEMFAFAFEILNEAGIQKIWNPEKVVAMLAAIVPVSNLAWAEYHRVIREGVKKFGIRNFYDIKAGICHQVMPEKGYLIPGQLVLGCDSHTCTYGAFGVASTGIGHTETAYVLATGKLWMRVPPTIKFILTGDLPPLVMSKDVILYIAGKYTTEVAQYKSVEFTGPTAEKMSIDSRMTMSNMGVEIGAKFAFFEANEKTIDYLKGRNTKPVTTFNADDDCIYEDVIELDVSNLEPQVAFPHNVGNAKPVSEVGEIKVDQAFLGSCTNGRLEDLQIAAEIIKGKKIHSSTRLIVMPASMEVYMDALKTGILETFMDILPSAVLHITRILS